MANLLAVYEFTQGLVQYAHERYFEDLEAELSGQQDELARLRNLLVVPGERSSGSALDREIKDLTFDIKEILESWSARRDRALAREIISITNDRMLTLNRIVQRLGELRLVREHSAEANQVSSVKLNREVPPIGINTIVGLEDEAEDLISSLKEETEKLDVISITGMPGSGKTTLAWKIYQNETIREIFKNRIWVDCIPEGLSWKDLCIGILKEFSYDSVDGDDLKNAVHGCLKDRFLLVLDAVWTADILQSTMDFFPKNGKVLITSRITSVCIDAHATMKPHKMCFLNEEESWDLLQLQVFGKLGECPEMLKSIGKRIAKNCDGLPLAITVVASDLMVTSSSVAARYLNEKWWTKVSENITSDNDRQRVFSSVRSSYMRLSHYEQDCLLYMGVFPEGHEILVRTLTFLWIAEGFVQDNGRLTLEETAELILGDLIDRNLVMVGKSYPNGQIKTCHLHKLMHRFCKYEAAEQGFYHELRTSGVALDRLMPLKSSCRRLCIFSSLSEYLSSGPKGPLVRSILCFNKEEEVLLPKSFNIRKSNYSSPTHKPLKLLRVLECRLVKFKKFPTRFSKLMNLRYISVSCDDPSVILKIISSLRFLKTLVVDTKLAYIELRANIWRMPALRHLVIKAAIVLDIRGEGEAGNTLQTLTRLAPECCTDDLFRRAPNLNRLGIRGQIAALLYAETLRRLERLEHLKLMNDAQLNCSLHQQFFPQNLKSLTLSATYLEWGFMTVLGGIGSLEILKLKNNAFKGESWSTVAGGFHRLGFLHVGTTNLVSWEASSDDCFPRLKWLVLKNCEQLRDIPSNLAKSLDTLEVEMCPNLQSSQPGN